MVFRPRKGETVITRLEYSLQGDWMAWTLLLAATVGSLRDVTVNQPSS